MNKPVSLFRFAALLAVLSLLSGVSAPQTGPGTLSAPGPMFTSPPPNSNAHYLDITTTRLLEILRDPKNRVSESFRVPEALLSTVGFWLQIYAKYSLYQILIYDKDRPDVIYEVVDSKSLFQKGLSPIAHEITATNQLKKTLAEYRGAFQQLIKNPKGVFPAESVGARLVATWGRRSRKEWEQILSRLRTQAGQRDRMMYGLSNADRFFPAMESIFRKFGVPVELTRLPLVESSFNIQAKSKADAVGVWQFLEKSAQEYLVVDSFHNIDERLSPIKSTYAAAKMFKRNRKILGDWGLAVIAYNHGPRNLVKISHKYRGEKIAELLNLTKASPLGYASRSFYAEYLAALHAERYRDELYGQPAKQHAEAISIVKMKKPASVFEIAALYNISIHELKIYNPDIFDLKRKLPAGTRVVLPRKHGESLVEGPSIAPSPSPASRGIASEVEFIEYVR